MLKTFVILLVKLMTDALDNIIIFKRNNSMNSYTLVPNYYSGFNAPAPMTYYQQPPHNLQILAAVSKALKLSLAHYATIPQVQTSAIVQETVFQVSICDKDVEKIVVENTKEEVLERNQNQRREEKEIIQQKNIIVKIKTQKKIQTPPQSQNNAQLSAENVQSLKSGKKSDTEITEVKEKPKVKKNHFHVKVPKVSLIETADLPTLGVSSCQITKKREALLKRQVESWNQKMKNRRDKREIRMLNN